MWNNALKISSLSQNECQEKKKGKVVGRRSRSRWGWGEVVVVGDTAVEHGTIGALWHQPLDSPSRSAKTLNSPTMNCCSGKGGFREFNFQHNWLYSTPLNAKEMVCSVCLCEELCLQRVSSNRRDRRRKTRDGEDRPEWEMVWGQK